MSVSDKVMKLKDGKILYDDLRSRKADIIISSSSGAIASFSDGANNMPIQSCKVIMEPIQDLHGYDSPWSPGGGKNLILFSDSAISNQQYSNISYTNNGVVVTSTSQYGRVGYSFAVTTGKTYTISFNAKKTGTVENLKFNDSAAWGDTAYGVIVLDSETLTSYTKTITATTDILFIGIYPNVSGNVIELQDVMLEEGSTATTFAPYSNICPITGHTDVTVIRRGKNLINDALRYVPSSGYYAYLDTTDTGYHTYLKAGTYTVSVDTNNQPYGLYIRHQNAASSLEIQFSGSTLTQKTITLDKDGYYRIWFYRTVDKGGVNDADIKWVQLESGSAVTEYEPFKSSTTYSVTFPNDPGTVYGGTIDLAKGELIVTHCKITVNKSDFIQEYSTGIGYRQTAESYPITKNRTSNWSITRAQQKCNRGLIANPYSETEFGNYVGMVYALSGSTASRARISEALYQSLGENDTVEFVYELETPTTYSITPTEICTLAGYNNICTDAGNIEIEYLADTKTYVDSKVSDVQINDLSIVQNGIANIPIATYETLGVVRPSKNDNYHFGVLVNNDGRLYLSGPSDTQIKAGTDVYKPITPFKQHAAAFYGLAKAASDTTQASSSNAVGIYTDDAKIAIQKMLGIYEAPWELIRQDSFTNETAGPHEITVDANGQPFELTDVVLQVTLPKNTNFVVAEYGVIELYYSTSASGYVIGMLNNVNGPKTNDWYGSVYLTQSGGATSIATSPYNESGNNRYVYIRNQADFQLVTYNIIKIRFRSVTGTISYKLYGKRKWT